MNDTDISPRPKSPEPEPGSSPASAKERGQTLWGRLKSLMRPGSLRDDLQEALDAESSSDSADFSESERTILQNVLKLGDMRVDDVMVPRSDIQAVEAHETLGALVARFRMVGHSRLPVYRGTLDQVIGMIHIKDVFPYLATGEVPPEDWTVLMRQPLYVPQARGALDVLADMRSGRTHLAIVVDEFSGTDGIITIEDLVEEIVGDIEDEHDEAPVLLIVPIGEGMWDADARAELDDVATIVGDPRLAEVEEAVDTLGGLAFVLAGQVPRPGAMLEHPSGWRIEVTAGDETHVTRLRLHRPEPRETAEGE